MKRDLNSTLSTADIYDAFATEYRAYSDHRSTYLAAIDRLILQRFREQVHTVLDFGAGDGVRGSNLHHRLKAKRLIQVDISEVMIKLCKDIGSAELVCHPLDKRLESYRCDCDLVISLWNVLGHIKTYEERVLLLCELRELLSPTGHIVFDVNNWHYEGYGKLKSRFRRAQDFLFPKIDRSDISFEWQIDKKTYPASGHLFTGREVRQLLRAADFKIIDMLSVNYETGAISRKLSKGQLFVVANRQK